MKQLATAFHLTKQAREEITQYLLPEDRSRGQVLLGSSSILWIMLSITVPLRYTIHPMVPFVLFTSIVSAIIFFLLPNILKATRNLRLCANIGILNLYALVFIASYHFNGLHAPITALFALFPVVAMFFSGYLSGVVYTALCYLSILTLYFLGSFGYLPIARTLSANEINRARLLITSSVVLISLAVAWLYEKAWRDSIALLRLLYQTSPDNIFVLDKHANIVFVSGAVNNTYSTIDKDWAGKHFFTFLKDGQDTQHLLELFKNPSSFSKQTEGQSYECMLFHPNKDESLPVEIVFGTSTQAKQKLIVAFARDISERFQVEKIKNELIANVSHELRTPLTSIYGSLRLLESQLFGKSSPPAQRLLVLAARNSERLLALVNDLLDVEKLTRGNMKFDFEIVNFVDLVEQSTHSMELLASDKSITLNSDLPSIPLYCRLDKYRVSQVITNLLSNAIKFSPPFSKIQVTLSQGASNYLKFSVSDQGEGIPPSKQTVIFERFGQAESSLTRKHEGSGLGLAISKKIIEELGGCIGLESTKGIGSTFCFELPIVDKDPDSSPLSPTTPTDKTHQI